MRLLRFLFFILWASHIFPISPASAEIVTIRTSESKTDPTYGDTLSVRRLLDEGVSINATNKKGESLLMLAAYEGDLVKVSYLIRAGADLNQRGGLLKSSALDYAVAAEREDIVDLLLESGVDVNEKNSWRVTAVFKAGRDGNYKMFSYLIGKGAVLSDEDKINILISCYSSYNQNRGHEKVVREILRDMRVEEEDIMGSVLMRNERKKEQICQSILSMQDKMAEERAEKEAERCRQDSLRHLIESGQFDTIRYRYDTMSRIDLQSGESTSVIQVRPRIDDVQNMLGPEATDTFLLLLLLTFLFLFYLSGLMIKHVYKEKPAFILHAINFVMGAFPVYLLVSCLYTNLDDIIIRKFGEEKEANIAAKDVQYTTHGRYGSKYTKWRCDFSFVFLNEEGVRIAVSQGNCKFDSENMEEGISDTTIKVRYDKKSMKLSVDDDKYLAQNLAWILFMCVLGVLLLLLCRGKFNKILAKIPGKTRADSGGNIVAMPALVSTYWKLSTRHYHSQEEFLKDVRRSEEQYKIKAEDRLDPDRVALEVPRVMINLFDCDIKGEREIKIEIEAPKGGRFTEGELLFLVHNGMIPYIKDLYEDTLECIILFAEPKKGKPAECILVFEEDDEDDDDAV